MNELRNEGGEQVEIPLHDDYDLFGRVLLLILRFKALKIDEV